MILVLNSTSGHSVENGSRYLLFVDAERVYGEALVAKDIRAQVDRRRTEITGAFSRKGQELQKQEAELIKKKNILSTEAFEKKVAEFRAEVEKVNRDAEGKMSELELMYNNALGQVYEKIQQVTKSIAEDAGAGLVLFMARGQAPYVSDSADVTDKVLEILNKDMSRVSLGD
ncbi:OmpH family outer membrane protein [Anaplasma platys]|nr:OmpH family outer membrane protein [Anaplasma platys]